MIIKKKYFMLFIILCLLTFSTGGSCDQTQLTGEIIVEDTRVQLGRKIPLQLEVPEELAGIYRVYWEVEPAQSGEIIEGEELLQSYSEEQLEAYFDTGADLNPDRIALFKPRSKGSCKIHVYGYFRQTNPQEITMLELEIIP